MIATLEGRVAEKLGNIVVLRVSGVGYGILVTSEDFGALAQDTDCKLYIYEHIREDSHELFGFRSFFTKQLFEQLLSVNGVGPKMALNILSLGSIDQLKSSIANGDAAFLQSASGVGKRLAERVIVDLKDKIGLSAAEALSGMLGSADLKDDATQALVALGFPLQDAKLALRGIDSKLPTEERIRLALQGESKNNGS